MAQSDQEIVDALGASTERRPSSAPSTYEAGYYYAPLVGRTPRPGEVPAEEVLLTISGTWPGNLANAIERMLAELDTVTVDEYSFRPETGKRYRSVADTLNDGVDLMISSGLDLQVGQAYTIVMDQDLPDSDTSRIVMYVLRTK